MALIIFHDGKRAYTDYNTAAKIWQILHNQELAVDKNERPRLMKIAENTASIDFKQFGAKK
jgi:hypothetical protein